MKVGQLEGFQLDYWVAKAEGVTGLVVKDGRMCHVEEWDPERWSWRDSLNDWVKWVDYAPSQRWDQGGPLVERERIHLRFLEDEGWGASLSLPNGDSEDWLGSTALTAAMRSYVASKFGQEVSDEETPTEEAA